MAQGGSPAGRSRGAIKLAAQILVLLVIILGAAELIAAYMLFRVGALHQSAFQPTGLASIYLMEKALKIPTFRPVSSVEPAPYLVPDERLGYVSTPGRHRVSTSVGRKTLSFIVTVPRTGERATTYVDVSRSHDMYVFGDSFMLGWGNNDEHTMPWLLEQRFSDYRVVNLAQIGYGITQAILQYQQLRDQLRQGDLLILPYADFYLVRDYGAPSWMRTMSQGAERRLGASDMTLARYPVTRPGSDGEPRIEYLNISCTRNGDYCDKPDPDRETLVNATKSIIRFFAAEKRQLVLAFLQGADDDPVISYARDLGLPIADIRLDHASPEWDDFGVFDGHPGPLAQFNYFEKLSRMLVEQHILKP
jgi:hypothetical protein